MDSQNTTRRGNRFVNLTNKTFGRWTVLREAQKRGRACYWACRCECGAESEVAGGALRGDRSSCCTGCRSVTHGKSTAPEYIVWRAMRSRCQCATHESYHNYGGRGITVCPEWDDFEGFYRDMGPRPTPKHTVERKDNDKGYSKENCIWATRAEQLCNTRRNRVLTFSGKTMCLAEWARELGIAYKALQHRINRGWSVERALTEPAR